MQLAAAKASSRASGSPRLPFEQRTLIARLFVGPPATISYRIRKSLSEPNRSVFVNCPFDKDFQPCFEAIIFTIAACGYRVRCALEDDDGANLRFDKLVQLIRQSERTIHDLSRVELSKAALPRFNMPFELGLAMGAKRFGNADQRKKTALVMVRQKFALPRYLSDLAGGDQHAHGNNRSKVIEIVSRYLHKTPEGGPLPGPQWLASSFALFKEKVLPEMAAAARRTIAETDSIDDYRVYVDFVNAFLIEAKEAGG